MKTPVFIQTILDAASLSGRHVAGLRGDFRSRLAAFRRNRAASEHSPVSFLSLACVAPPCLLGMVTTLWRISILRHRRFTPLCRWLLRFRKRP